MTVYLSPVNGPFIDANGNPLSGGKISTYQAGTSTPLATFTSNTGMTQQANPIILNALGLPTSPIWLNASSNYKYVITNSADAAHQTIDNISGINDVSAASSEWNESGFVPTYISATSFSVPGDQTALLQVNRRIRTRNTSGYVYSRISASVYGSATTVTVVNDSTTLDSGLSLVAYSFLSPSPNSIPYGAYVSGGAIGEAAGVLLGSKIQSISASVGSNALTISASQLSLDFRSATLTSGTITTVTGTPANLVISSGSTLGTVSARQSRITVLAINNAGTIELAAVNLCGVDLSETGLISTTAEGGAGAADSGIIAYSTTARSNVAYRVLGFIESTQATAGTWATAPSTIQGAGGESLIQSQGLVAWCYFNGTTAGTNAPTSGRNIASVTRNGAGDYTANFTNVMPDANFAIIGSGAVDSARSPGNTGYVVTPQVAGTPAAGARVIVTYGGAATDLAIMYIAVFR